MNLRYRQLEAALAEVTKVPPRKMGAFRARLRHLRNIGAPRLPRTGSGQPISYSPIQALELCIALQLENLGTAPKWAGRLAGSVIRQGPHSRYKGEDFYAIVRKSSHVVTMVWGWKSFLEFLRSTREDVFGVINVSVCKGELDSAIERALAAV
jgi:hypothetical protein